MTTRWCGRPPHGSRAMPVDAYAYAKAAFEFVRDTIPHSQDAGDPRVTWRASDVLEQRTGICYAKAHALAALLRAEGIPAGAAATSDDDVSDVVHGLVAVRLPRGAGHRQDPRGNKPGVDARFSLDGERLAFGSRTRSPMRWTIRYCMLHRTRSSLNASRRPRTGRILWQTLPTAL